MPSSSSRSTGAAWPLASFTIEQIQTSLLAWYHQQGRDLPWRHTRDPYAIWVSEIMLQQTQVKTVLPYYHRWLQQFPTLMVLAQADQQTVLKAWEGLGYYARARNLHRAAQIVATEYSGRVPSAYEDIITLPGIGRTTAGGILSAAFNQPLPILDGNVKRILSRLIALRQPPSKALNNLWQISETILPVDNPRDFNQALMDLGATLCTRHRPVCLLCPWQSICAAYNQNVQLEIPMTETRAPLPHKHIGVAVVWNEQGQILIDRRPQQGLLGGLWEFPGGKIEPDETVEECIRRELQEELAIEVQVGDRLITIEHTYTHFKVTLNVFHGLHVAGDPQTIECDEVRWVEVNELEQFPFPKANIQIIDVLKSTPKPVWGSKLN